ncbi:MAG TPA: hypothetical protein VFD77_08840 [Brumimicrobium sp.]|nr:hypothetical protein [Brumimicrobium sp.]
MVKIFKYFVFLVLPMGLSSCFELIEDTTLNADGSGNYKLTLNLSASTTRINSIMAMDSVDGKKVPSRNELNTEFQKHLKKLEAKEGISNVSGSINTENWIVKVDLNFKSLAELKEGMIALSKEINKHKSSENINEVQLSYQDNLYTRKFGEFIPEKWQNQIKSDQDFSRLNEGKCVFIQRFDREVSEVSSKEARISKSKKAVMLQLSPTEIVNHPEKLDYTIKTAP